VLKGTVVLRFGFTSFQESRSFSVCPVLDTTHGYHSRIPLTEPFTDTTHGPTHGNTIVPRLCGRKPLRIISIKILYFPTARSVRISSGLFHCMVNILVSLRQTRLCADEQRMRSLARSGTSVTPSLFFFASYGRPLPYSARVHSI
jgi:hypothetical protein